VTEIPHAGGMIEVDMTPLVDRLEHPSRMDLY
jgi:hypothetical protein